MKDDIKKLFPKEFYINKNEELVAEITLENLNKIVDCIINLYQENEYLKKNQRFHKRFKEDSIFCLEYDKETLKDLVFELQQRIDKAIDYIKWQQGNPQYDNLWRKYECDELIKILKGDYRK